MRNVVRPRSDPAVMSMSATLGSRLLLLLEGFSEREAAALAFLRWLVEEGALGGVDDGASQRG
jgi:hypothetical protein